MVPEARFELAFLSIQASEVDDVFDSQLRVLQEIAWVEPAAGSGTRLNFPR
jgi:hypothetical protein